jgi:hypothetical protein
MVVPGRPLWWADFGVPGQPTVQTRENSHSDSNKTPYRKAGTPRQYAAATLLAPNPAVQSDVPPGRRIPPSGSNGFNGSVKITDHPPSSSAKDPRAPRLDQFIKH